MNSDILSDIFKRAQRQLDFKLAFVLYSKPNEKALNAIFQKDQKCYVSDDFSIPGFIFAPFDLKTHPCIVIPYENSEKILLELNVERSFTIQGAPFSETINTQNRSEYLDLIEHTVKAIKQNACTKIVISRRESVPLPYDNYFEVFARMIQLYPNAMVYFFYHPELGTWMGATPEKLIRIESGILYSVSLAGTIDRTKFNTPVWTEKELKEQRIVTDYIAEQLMDKLEEIEISHCRTIKAGSLFHLCSEITGSLKSNFSNIREIIQKIHPTPAVCGYPKEEAMRFIKENESYERTYYTGFIGEIGKASFPLKNSSGTQKMYADLFVNLRCMQIKNSQALIYVGGGITADSIPENEWLETVAKTSTMKKALFYN
jgi:isochorismate synthase